MGYGPPNRTAFGQGSGTSPAVRPDLVRADNAGAFGAGSSARCDGRCRSGRYGLPLVPREDAERFGSQQVKALLAAMVRAAFLVAPRVADQNERGLRVTLYLLPQGQ